MNRSSHAELRGDGFSSHDLRRPPASCAAMSHAAQALIAYQQALRATDEMEDSGAMNKTTANLTRAALKAEYKAALKGGPAAAVLAVGQGSSAQADADAPPPGEAEKEKKEKKEWPVSRKTSVLIAERYDTYAQARLSVEQAWKKNTLYSQFKDSNEASTSRCRNPKGTGVPARGYLDYEFEGGIGCRCALMRMIRMIRTIRIRYILHNHDTHTIRTPIRTYDTRTIHIRYEYDTHTIRS